MGQIHREALTRFETVTLDYQIPVWKEGSNKDATLKRITLRDFFASDVVTTAVDPPNWATNGLVATGSHIHNLNAHKITLQNGTHEFAANLVFRMLGSMFAPGIPQDNTLDKVLAVDSSTGQIKYTTGITNGSIAPMAANTFKANITGGTAAPTDVARTDLTNSLPYASDSIVGFTAAGNLVRFTADKLLNTMTSQTTSEGSITVDLGSMQVKAVTALGISAVIPAPGGTPTNGMSLTYRLKDDGTPRALTWNAIFRGVNGVTLPAATLGSTSDLLIIKCLYNVADSKWDVYFVGGSAGLSDSDYGDITVSSSGTVMTIDNGVVSNAKLADVATSTFKGRATAGSGDPEDLTAAQARTILNVEDGADVTDATNVTAAGALMDSEVTNLAQVKSFDSADYATAAQGTLADSAQQPPSEGAFVNGDKTKLDGIETGATADQTASEIRTLLGTGNSGVVPAAGTAGHFLKHDGTFGLPNYTTNTDTQLSDSEVETAYNNQVDVVSQVDAEAGTSTDVKRWTPQRVKQAIDALASSATNLSEGTTTNTTVDVNSSTGTNATLASASTTRAGLMSKAKFDEVVANTAKVTNATHTGDVTGSTALTIADDAVTYAKMQNVAANNVLLGNDDGAGSAAQELTAAEVRTLLNVSETGAAANKPTLSKTIVLESPADADYIPIFRTDVAITIQEALGALMDAGDVDIRLYWDVDLANSGPTAIGAQTTLTSTTEASVDISTDATIPADSWIFLDVGTVATPQTTVVNIRYTED